MRKRNMQIKYSHNQGSALITVLVVVTVLMIIVLSVLSISYEYFMTESTDMYKQKCQDTVQSLSKELRSEIAGAKYSNYEEQKVSSNELWLYLRENIAQENWPYYQVSDSDWKKYSGSNDPYEYDSSTWKQASGLQAAKRYFDLLPEDAESEVLKEELPITTICLYWEPGTYSDRVADIKLHVETTCKMGDYSYTIREVYKLKTDTYAGVPVSEQQETVEANTVPGEMIYKNQKWEWEYAGEE